MNSSIKAVSFDLWDTVFVDDSDEPKRARMGLKPKAEERQDILHALLQKHSSITREQILRAYEANEKEFRRIWHDEFNTLTVDNRLRLLLRELGVGLPADDLRGAVLAWEEMERDFPPDLAPGVTGALEKLAGKYQLAVLSDAIVSPGRVLRGILEEYGLLDFFSVFTFSDEIGASKPAPLVFQETARQLGVPPGEVVHIGDRAHNDILGPQKAGMRAILFDGVRQRPLEGAQPDAVCSDYAKLPEIISGLTARR